MKKCFPYKALPHITGLSHIITFPIIEEIELRQNYYKPTPYTNQFSQKNLKKPKFWVNGVLGNALHYHISVLYLGKKTLI